MQTPKQETGSGRFVQSDASGRKVWAFVPYSLPPPIDLTALVEPLTQAAQALGRLDGITLLLPRPEFFLFMYVRKEAVLSSQIEGTQSTLGELLRFESDAQAGHSVDDLREVSNYVDATMHGMQQLRDAPLSLELIRELHARLLQSGRGSGLSPGQFRHVQNWIGGTGPATALFVPPPPSALSSCLQDLEAFFQKQPSALPAIINAGLIHVQFETIHPFRDGNGRIGRLLVTLYLCASGVLSQPMLYLSLFLKAHRADYYRLLQNVREHAAWTDWLHFFLTGVAETANQAFTAATQLTTLLREDRQHIVEQSTRANSALRVHESLQQFGYVNASQLADKTGLSAPTVNATLADLVRLGLISEVTGRRRGRVYAYDRYLAILGEGTEPD